MILAGPEKATKESILVVGRKYFEAMVVGVPEIKYFASGQFKVNTALFSGSQSSLLINHSTISD